MIDNIYECSIVNNICRNIVIIKLVGTMYSINIINTRIIYFTTKILIIINMATLFKMSTIIHNFHCYHIRLKVIFLP